jgi:hypothetical protein
MRTFMYVISVAILLWLVCACTEDGEEVAGCEDLLELAETSIECSEYYVARCQFAEDNSGDWFEWYIEVYRHPDWRNDDVEFQRRINCLGSFLEQRGVRDSVFSGGNLYVIPAASYSQIAPIFRFKRLIHRIEVSCSDPPSEPCRCAGRNREACGESAFCYGFGGEKYDRARACKVGYVAVTCASYIWGEACGDTPITMVDTAGNCWWWPHTCYPEVTDWIEEDWVDWADESSEYWGDGWCSDENLHSLPDCEE